MIPPKFGKDPQWQLRDAQDQAIASARRKSFWRSLYLVCAVLLILGVGGGYALWAVLSRGFGSSIRLPYVLAWGTLPALVMSVSLGLLGGGEATPSQRFLRAIVVLALLFLMGLVVSMAVLGLLAISGALAGITIPGVVVFIVATGIGAQLLRLRPTKWRLTNWIVSVLGLPPYIVSESLLAERRALGECLKCGYPMRDLPSKRCPECGGSAEESKR